MRKSGFDYDAALGHRYILGADEVGRGCVAGPIMAGAVILDQARLTGEEQAALERLTDSKKLTPRRRAALAPEIMSVASAFCVAAISHRAIDERGIEWANREALRRAITALKRAFPEAYVLVDGYGRGLDDVCDRALVGGDGISAAIGAASVLAKEARDRLMRAAGERWPQWGYGRHMGYLTKAHREAIERHGPSPWQRRSFRV